MHEALISLEKSLQLRYITPFLCLVARWVGNSGNDYRVNKNNASSLAEQPFSSRIFAYLHMEPLYNNSNGWCGQGLSSQIPSLLSGLCRVQLRLTYILNIACCTRTVLDPKRVLTVVALELRRRTLIMHTVEFCATRATEFVSLLRYNGAQEPVHSRDPWICKALRGVCAGNNIMMQNATARLLDRAWLLLYCKCSSLLWLSRSLNTLGMRRYVLEMLAGGSAAAA